jgi:diguanylate cyclase (GGDEF)-like protein
MPKNKTQATTRDATARTLAAAFEQNKDVEARVEGAACDLASSGAVLETKIAGGHLEVAAEVALKVSKEVEDKVNECAEDLHTVNETLAKGVTALKLTEDALAVVQGKLVATRSALVEAKEGEEKARHAAMHDVATGLPNREFFNSRLKHDIAVAARHGFDLAVMFFDLNKFKAVNDTFGHAAGDEILKCIGTRLLEHCRTEDTVCRTGGDEFLYLLIAPKGRDNVARIASALADTLALPVTYKGQQIIVRPSTGISLYPEDGKSASQLISKADAAMFVAKKASGGLGWAFYAAPILRAA